MLVYFRLSQLLYGSFMYALMLPLGNLGKPIKVYTGARGWGVFNCNEKNEQHNPYSSSLFNETILHSNNTASHCNTKEGSRDYMVIAKQTLLSCNHCCGNIQYLASPAKFLDGTVTIHTHRDSNSNVSCHIRTSRVPLQYLSPSERT